MISLPPSGNVTRKIRMTTVLKDDTNKLRENVISLCCLTSFASYLDLVVVAGIGLGLSWGFHSWREKYD